MAKVENVFQWASGSSVKARITCPWCGVVTSGSAQVVHYAHRAGSAFEYVATYKCGDVGCGRASLLYKTSVGGVLAANTDHNVTVFPSGRSSYGPIGVPPSIAQDFREALDSRSAAFNYGAAVVARRVLQAAVRTFTGELKDLYNEINALTSDQLPKPLRDAAHEVRFVGNDAAHSDQVTPAEVDDLLEFTEEVLHQLFVVPAKVAAAAARRAQKP